MKKNLFHIFRNNPLGRETLRQAIFFCRKNRLKLVVYIPTDDRFLMYFEEKVIEVKLDSSFLSSPESAKQHVEELILPARLTHVFWEPQSYTNTALPDVPVDMDFMCCPRSLSDKVSKLGLGYLGPKVRAIVRSASFPVLIPSPVFQKWRSIAVFFGGSDNAVNALKLSLKIAATAGVKIAMYTQIEKDCTRENCEQILREEGLENALDPDLVTWYIFESKSFEENLYHVQPDSLVVLGSHGKGMIKKMVFGGKTEKIQETLPNNLLVIGPHCRGNAW